MRRRAMLSLAIAGMFILAAAGVGQANWSHKSKNSGETTSGMTSPTSEPGNQAPEVGTYEYQKALETGSLPPSEGSRVSGKPMSPGGEEIHVVEQGGLKFREGIDTGP